MLSGILSFAVTEWLGLTWSCIVGGLMIAGGVYLAGFVAVADKSPLYPLLKPLRYVGIGLAVAGILVISAAYFKHVGAQQCETAWKEKNLETQIADLKRDVAAAKAIANQKDAEAQAAAAMKHEADEQLVSYADYAAGLSSSLAACRRATGADDRRLCDLVGNRAAGCKPAAVPNAKGRLSPGR